MSIEFTFLADASQDWLSTTQGASFFFDPRRSAHKLTLVEEAGFHGVVVDDPAGLLSNLDLSASAVASASSLQVVVTHWAGVMSPTVAASRLSALDAESGGRLALRILADGVTASVDGERVPSNHIEIWQRTDEYLTLLKRLWSNDLPFDHEGPFYSVRNGFVGRKGPRGFAIPVRMGGLSGTALKVAARHADIFELEPGEPEMVRMLMERVRIAASRFGRADKIRFALPVRFSGERPALIAFAILEHIRAGVSEFMISGMDSPDAIEDFGVQMAALLRGGEARGGARSFARAVNTSPARRLCHLRQV